MELDKRIIPGKRPLTRLDAEQAKEFIGKECYFSDVLDDFEDLDEFKDKIIVDGCYVYLYKGKLNGVFANDGRFIVGKNDISYRFDYCLPCEWVREEKKEKEEPRFRPYTKNEFLNKFECGKPIIIRHKDDHINVFIETLSSVRIDNYMDEVYIHLYEGIVDLQKMFDEFEWQQRNGDWQPFGILEEYQP